MLVVIGPGGHPTRIGNRDGTGTSRVRAILLGWVIGACLVGCTPSRMSFGDAGGHDTAASGHDLAGGIDAIAPTADTDQIVDASTPGEDATQVVDASTADLAADAIPDAPGATVTLIEGVDYSLPVWVKPEPFSGYAWHREPSGNVRIKNWKLSWRALEPARGQYAWHLVDDALDKAKAGGYRLIMQLHSVVVGGSSSDQSIIVGNSVPDWVFDQLGSPTGRLGGEFNLEVIPAWRADIRDAFNTLLREFGRRGYPQRDELVAAYVHGISQSRGEEFHVNQAGATQIESSLGFSASACTTWIKSRIDAYAEAFEGATHKLVWVGSSLQFNFGDYAGMAWDLVQYGWNRGAGTRGGIVEKYHYKANDRAYGQSIGADGYFVVDEDTPPVATVRYFGDENEEYGESWEWRYGPSQHDARRYRFAILRALQMRIRFLWTSPAAEALDPELSTYARLSFGKTAQTSPDAWVYLKESPLTIQPKVQRNFERWLVQRDVAGGQTVPAVKVAREFDAGYSPAGQWYDYVARRTDVATGNRYIYFRAAESFVVDGLVAVHVEFVDNSPARWRIEYNGAQKADQATPWVQGSNDGVVRTAVFTLPDAKFSGALAHDMDLRLATEGAHDITVKWVRVRRPRLPGA